MIAKAAYLIVFLATICNILRSGLVDSEYANCPNPPFSFIDAKCKVTRPDGTEIVCQKDILSTSLKINVLIKRCDTPISIDVTIKTTSYEWFEQFSSSQMSPDIPHSGNPNTKLRLRVSLDNTTTSIGFKVVMVTGYDQHGRFNISSSYPLVDGELKRSVNDCAPTIKQGFDTLSGGEIAGVVVGSIIGFVLLCVVCFWLVSYSIAGECCNELDGVSV